MQKMGYYLRSEQVVVLEGIQDNKQVEKANPSGGTGDPGQPLLLRNVRRWKRLKNRAVEGPGSEG